MNLDDLQNLSKEAFKYRQEIVRRSHYQENGALADLARLSGAGKPHTFACKICKRTVTRYWPGMGVPPVFCSTLCKQTYVREHNARGGRLTNDRRRRARAMGLGWFGLETPKVQKYEKERGLFRQRLYYKARNKMGMSPQEAAKYVSKKHTEHLAAQRKKAKKCRTRKS